MRIIRVEDQTGGKYYSTELTVTLSDGRTVDVLLSSGDGAPSYLETADPDFEICDGHYEREATRIVADVLLNLANNEENVGVPSIPEPECTEPSKGSLAHE